jgi:hypothetical protein
MTTSQKAVGSAHKKRTSSSVSTEKSPTVRIDGESLLVGETDQFPIVNHCVNLPVLVANGIQLRQVPRGIKLIIARGDDLDQGIIRFSEIMIQNISPNLASVTCRAEYFRKDWSGVLGMEIWARLMEASVKSHPRYDPRRHILSISLNDEGTNISVSVLLKCETVLEAFGTCYVMIEDFECLCKDVQWEVRLQKSELTASANT